MIAYGIAIAVDKIGAGGARVVVFGGVAEGHGVPGPDGLAAGVVDLARGVGEVGVDEGGAAVN
jgi:hypothetical protein